MLFLHCLDEAVDKPLSYDVLAGIVVAFVDLNHHLVKFGFLELLYKVFLFFLSTAEVMRLAVVLHDIEIRSIEKYKACIL